MDTPQPEAPEQPAPSPARNALPAIRPVTAVIIAAAIPATFWSWTHPDDAFPALYSSGFDLWSGSGLHALITSALLHGDFLHLVFNLYWLWILGSFLESKIGSVRYALIALGSAFLSSVAELAWSGEMGIGLSGVLYAIFGILLVRRRHDPDTASVLPIGRVWLFIGWFFLCIVLTRAGIMPVANAAHAAGLLAGLWYGSEIVPAFRRLRPALGVLTLAAAIGILFWAPWHEHWHLARLARMEQAGRDANFRLAALAFANRFPDNVWGMEYEAWDAKTDRNHARVAELYERMIVLKRDANTLNSLAWLRATCPEPALRDGAAAIRLAREACDLTDWKRHEILNTLAAAYAESGRFDEAIATNEKAITLAPDSDKSVLVPHTEAFRAGRAWREEPTPTTP
jgi:membrane associated rhomboid family serine protease